MGTWRICRACKRIVASDAGKRTWFDHQLAWAHAFLSAADAPEETAKMLQLFTGELTVEA